MKTKTPLIIICFIICITAIGQTTCSKYYPFKNGTTFQITNFDKKGNKAGVVDYKISQANSHTASVSAKISDEKDKEITTSEFKITCNEKGVSIDFKSLMKQEMFDQFKDMDIDISGTDIEIPNNLEVGQSLADARVNMAINMAGMKMNMNIDMVNRKVVAQESITTAAGTFKCFALSYNSEINMGIKQSFAMKEWIAENVGLVKSESYDKNGKLIGSSELTKINL